MVDFDPYGIIEQVIHGMLDSKQKHFLSLSCLDKVQFGVVLVYGCQWCKIMPRAQFVFLQRNDVLGMYSQSIPVPLVANWLCYELQELFGEYADIATLAVAYVVLLDNHRSIDNKVTDPTQVHSDLLRYSLFYYLLRVDINMDRWTTIHVCKNSTKCDCFVYDRMLKYMLYSYLNMKV
jgi:hypothetical protein